MTHSPITTALSAKYSTLFKAGPWLNLPFSAEQVAHTHTHSWFSDVSHWKLLPAAAKQSTEELQDRKVNDYVKGYLRSL